MVLLRLREISLFVQIVTTMSLSHPSTPQLNLFEQEAPELLKGEAAIQQAISLYNSKTYSKLSHASQALGCPPSTVYARIHGRRTRQAARADQQALNQHAEDALVTHLREAESRGFPHRNKDCQEIAEELAGRPLGKNWFTRFIKRRLLKSVFTKTINTSRAYNYN